MKNQDGGHSFHHPGAMEPRSHSLRFMVSSARVLLPIHQTKHIIGPRGVETFVERMAYGRLKVSRIRRRRHAKHMGRGKAVERRER